MVEKAILNILENDAGLVALHGTRVFALVANQNTARPYMVFHRAPSQDRHDVQAIQPAELNEGTYEITVVADSYFSAKTVAEELRLSFSRRTGTFAGVTIQAIFFVDEFDDYQLVVNGGESYFYTVTTVWRIAFNETTS